MKKKVGIILFGSGFLDGSEIRESVGVLWAISQKNAEAFCFAVDKQQVDVMDCLNKKPIENEKRNGLTEAARIARGNIKNLNECKASELDALIIPGGFGVAKNLCTFANEGSSGSVDKEVLRVLKEFKALKKPIGAVCIAPALLALAFKGEKIELTLGQNCEASQEIEKIGHKHIECKAFESHTDKNHKIVSTPAYMIEDAPLHEIFQGIQKLTHEVLTLS